MRMRRRLLKLFFWALVLCTAIPAGGLWYMYYYMTESTTVARMIREYAVKYLRDSELMPGHVKLRPLAGELVLREIFLHQKIDGLPFTALRIPYFQMQFNPKKMAQGEIELGEIHISHPTLRLKRRRDGTWNLQRLLVSPWPGPWLEHSPPIVIQNGRVELAGDDEAASDTEAANGRSAASLTERSSSAAESGASRSAFSQALVPTDSSPQVRAFGPILHDLSLSIEPAGKFLYKFEGTARSDNFDRIVIKGAIDLNTGVLELKGELIGLTLSPELCRRVPSEAQPALRALALKGGVVDIELVHFRFDPNAAPGKRFIYGAQARLREGVWDCPKLPYPINELTGLFRIENNLLTIVRARGSNGQMSMSAEGTIGLTGSNSHDTPLDLRLKVTDLELDDRLRRRTPAEYDDLWDVFKPHGRIDAAIHVARKAAGQPLDFSVNVYSRDVGAEYRHFRYPLDHMAGTLSLEKNFLRVDFRTLTAPLVHVRGLIENPGLDAIVKLDIEAESVPLNDTFRKALPADVRPVIDQFHPSGQVSCHATVFRKPMVGPDPRPEGLMQIDADVDLTGQCEMTWAQLPYPVRNLTGKLQLHPDHWIFQNIRGKNGQAEIAASGSVHMLHERRLPNGEDPLEVTVSLSAKNLPFNGELRQALPPAWKKTWATINPSGSCDIKAEVHHRSGRPDSTHILIQPSPESNVRLQFSRSPQPGFDPGGPVELRMEDVSGKFDFLDGKVTMHDVNFQFRGELVRFAHGTVVVEDTGRFDLDVHDLWVRGIRFDADLRKKMPPLMSQFAMRLDDGRTFRARGDLQIGWSGIASEPAWCRWDKTLVVFNGNSLKTGIPLEHIQGQIEHVSGWSDGRVLEVQGILKLASVMFLGQQITEVESPFHVKDGMARLDSISARFLNGQLTGEGEVSLDTTPRYRAAFSLDGAQLEEYARTLAGRQSFRGLVSARMEVNGLGSDVHALSGQGEAHITQGDLGALPPVFKFAKALNGFLYIDQPPPAAPRASGRTADFDSANVSFTISHGATVFELIKFTGNAFSLQGQGTMDPQANLDLRLNVLWGRDRFHVPLLSDVARQASTSLFLVRVQGTPSAPRFYPDPLPQVSGAVRSLQKNLARRQGQ
jgi:hypothetical protein